MGICQSDIDRIIQPGNVLIDIHEKHSLLQLGQALPWRDLVEIIMPELKKTNAGHWWVGRILKVRIHLGTYLLQQLFNKTDRHITITIAT